MSAKTSRGRTRRSCKRIVEKITNLEKSQVELIFKKNSIEEHLWIEYEKKIKEIDEIKRHGRPDRRA